MAKKTRAAAPRLQALQALGNLRALRAEAERVLATPDGSDADREEARKALDRTRPERGAAVAFGIGLALFVAVALLGILVHR